MINAAWRELEEGELLEKMEGSPRLSLVDAIYGAWSVVLEEQQPELHFYCISF